MSTDCAIIADHVPEYANKQGLIEMMPAVGKTTTAELFDSVIREIYRCNSAERRHRRLVYALDNSYPNVKQLDRIATCAALCLRWAPHLSAITPSPVTCRVWQPLR